LIDQRFADLIFVVKVFLNNMNRRNIPQACGLPRNICLNLRYFDKYILFKFTWKNDGF